MVHGRSCYLLSEILVRKEWTEASQLEHSILTEEDRPPRHYQYIRCFGTRPTISSQDRADPGDLEQIKAERIAAGQPALWLTSRSRDRIDRSQKLRGTNAEGVRRDSTGPGTDDVQAGSPTPRSFADRRSGPPTVPTGSATLPTVPLVARNSQCAIAAASRNSKPTAPCTAAASSPRRLLAMPRTRTALQPGASEQEMQSPSFEKS